MTTVNLATTDSLPTHASSLADEPESKGSTSTERETAKDEQQHPGSIRDRRPPSIIPDRLDHMRQRLAAGISQRGIHFGIPTNQQAQAHAHETHGEDSLEHRTLAFLHQRWVQSTLAGLLLFDVILLFTELALMTSYPQCHLIRRDGISCCAPTGDEDEALRMRLLAGSGDGSYYCEDPTLVPKKEYEAGCDEHKWHKVHSAEEAMFYMTITILSIFMVELLVTMWAIKPWIFFRQAFYALDFTIVSASIALESTFHALDDDTLATMIGLLILGRVWRFVRIGHGMVELVSNMNRQQYEELLAYTEDLEAKLKQNRIDLSTSHKKPARDVRRVSRKASSTPETERRIFTVRWCLLIYQALILSREVTTTSFHFSFMSKAVNLVQDV